MSEDKKECFNCKNTVFTGSIDEEGYLELRCIECGQIEKVKI